MQSKYPHEDTHSYLFCISLLYPSQSNNTHINCHTNKGTNSICMYTLDFNSGHFTLLSNTKSPRWYDGPWHIIVSSYSNVYTVLLNIVGTHYFILYHQALCLWGSNSKPHRHIHHNQYIPHPYPINHHPSTQHQPSQLQRWHTLVHLPPPQPHIPHVQSTYSQPPKAQTHYIKAISLYSQYYPKTLDVSMQMNTKLNDGKPPHQAGKLML